MSRQGALQRCHLVGDAIGARGPQAEEDLGLGLDGGIEGFNGVARGIGLDVGVQSHSVELAGGSLQALGGGELGKEIGLELGRIVRLRGARVEAEVVFGGGRDRGEGAGGEGGGC